MLHNSSLNLYSLALEVKMGPSDLDALLDYIDNQEEHHRTNADVPGRVSSISYEIQGGIRRTICLGLTDQTGFQPLTILIRQPGALPLQLPLPPLATQQAFVAEIEAEQKLVVANCDLHLQLKEDEGQRFIIQASTFIV
jgi:hypothetical protein